MATRRYGLSKGDEQIFVTEAVGAATAADDVELTVDFDSASGLNQAEDKHEILRLIQRLWEHVNENGWPPA